MKQLFLGLFLSFFLLSAPAFGQKTPVKGVWVLSSMDKVDHYDSIAPNNKVILHLAKGEAEHFQIVLDIKESGPVSFQQLKPRKDVSVSLNEIREFEEKLDVLVPVKANISTEKNPVKLWVTYETSINTRPGKYNDILKFTSTAGTYEVHVSYMVYDVTIPVKPSIPAVMGIRPDLVSSLEGEEMITKKKDFSDELLRRRMTPFYCVWHANKIPMAVECISSPYPWDDPRTLDYMDDERFTHLFMPSHFLSTEEIKTFSSQVRERMPDKDQIYYVRDEPLVVADYQLIRDKATEIYNVNPAGKVLTTYFRGAFDPKNENFNDFLAVWDHLRGYNDIFCTGVWAFQFKEDRAEKCRLKCRPHEEFWTYTAMDDRPGLSHANETTPIDNHAVAWRLYKETVKGYLYWVVNAYSTLTPLKSRPNLPKGDGILLYPGESFNSDVPVISMRLERFRDGLEEYELLRLLEQKTSREHVLSILDDVYRGPASHEGQVSSDPNEVVAFRVKLLEELSRKK